MKDTSKNVCSCLCIAGTALGLSVQTKAGAVGLTFEGLQDNELVEDFYNGGFGSMGSGPGPQLGIIFLGAVAQVDRDAGGSGDFGGEPSPSTAIFSTDSITINVPASFETGLSFFYSNLGGSTNIRIEESGVFVDETFGSTLLEGAPDPTGTFSPLVSAGVSFSGAAQSVQIFSRGSGGFYLDNVTIGSATPVPEPDSALSMLTLGALGGGLWLKRKLARLIDSP